MQLFKDIYQETETWPKIVFSLMMDIRRAAMGVSANLEEVHKHTWNEFLEFLTISQDSLADLKNHLTLARKNPALSTAALEPLMQRLGDLSGALQRLRGQ